MKPEDDLDAWLAEANQDLADATADAFDVEATLAEVRQQAAATEVVTPHLVPEAVIAPG